MRALLALVTMATAAHAGAPAPDAPWEGAAFAASPSALARAAAAVEGPEGTPVVVLLEEGRYTFDADGRADYRYRLLYRVMSEEGVKDWGDVSALWSPWYEERPELRARVILPGGAEHVLDPETVGEAPEREDSSDVYRDRKALRGPLPAVVVGAVVEEALHVPARRPFFEGGSTYRWYFGKGVRVLKSRFVLDAPASLPLRHLVRLAPSVTPRREEAGGRTVWTFEAGPLEPLEPLPDALPSEHRRWPQVAVSTGVSWQDVAERYARIVDGQVAEAELSAAVREARRGGAGREALIERLTARLHRDVRYTGVEFGEAAIVPRSPAETLRRRYGDCKDKSALLVALLRAAGLPAHLALLSLGPGADIEPELPGLGSFDHAIVAVEGDPIVWIDATDEFSRPGQLPLAAQGRWALIARPGTQGLVRLPQSGSADNQVLCEREFFLAERGPARVVETTETAGSIEREYRAALHGADPKEVREGREQYARTQLLAKKLGAVEASDTLDFSRPFRIRLEMMDAARGSADDDEAVVAIPLGALIARLPAAFTGEEDEEEDEAARERRREDYVLQEPFRSEWRYRIHPPPGFTPGALPDSREVALGPAKLSQSYSAGADGVVTATVRFDTGPVRIPAEGFEALRKGVREQQEASAVIVRFAQVGEAHLAAGRVREAMAEFRRLAALHPREALHEVQLAQALLAGGLGDASREAGRRALSLEPRSALAHRTLGWLLQHDGLGRRFRAGADLPGAEAALRKAKELDPTDVVARGDLAILLEHDATGRRYAPGARLAEAIEEYRSLKADGNRNLDMNLLTALMWAGRFDRLKEAAQETEPSVDRHAFIVLAVAATQGAEAALREAARIVPSGKDRRLVLERAGASLRDLRRYPESAALIEASASGAENAAALLAQASGLRRVVRHETLPMPEGDPANVVKRMLLLMKIEGTSVPDEMMAPFDLTEDEKSNSAALLQGFRQAMRAARTKVPLPTEVLLDAALSVLQTTVEGDDGFGYRIRTRIIAPQGATDQVVYVVKRAEGNRLLTLGGFPARIGREALRRAEAGDLPAARRWLDWAREEIEAPGGDDPLAGPVFPRFWTKGQEADLAEIRLAAAALASGESDQAWAPPILSAALAGASGTRRLHLEVALAQVLRLRGKHAEMLPLAEHLQAEQPDSVMAFRLHFGALIDLKRLEEARALAQARAQRLPDDTMALTSLARVAEGARDFTGAMGYYRRLVALGRPGPGHLNNLAWNALVLDQVTDESVEQARQAVDLSRGASAASLNTLAALYAEVGRTAEAREALLKALELGPSDAPDSQDWYVIGRIAEHYEMRAAAVAAYRKVAPGPGESVGDNSPFSLAARRLSVLGAATAKR